MLGAFFRGLLKILGIGIFFVFLISLFYLLRLNQAVTHKSYGVDKTTTHLECSTHMALGSGNKEIDFFPLIYTANKNCKNIRNLKEYLDDYAFMRVVLYPMRKEPKKYDGWLSSVQFFMPQKKINGKFVYAGDNIIIQKDSIRLVHKTIGGAILPYEKEEITYLPPNSSKAFQYQKFYKKDGLPERMKVYVYFEMAIDGKPITVEREFPIQLETEFTLWDLFFLESEIMPLSPSHN